MPVNFKPLRLLLLYGVLSLWSANLLASANTISAIEFLGNSKTHESVLFHEIVIKQGDFFSTEKIERSRQNIMDLGLFRSVSVNKSSTDDGTIVTFVVDEKRYWYVVPVFSRGSDGDITYGARMQMDNLLGLNKQLIARAKRKSFADTDIQVEKTLEVEYRYPRIFDSIYDLALHLDFDEADIEESRGVLSGDYFREKVSYGVRLSRWLVETGPSKGLRLSLGLRSEQYDHEFLRGDPNLFSDVTVNSLVSGIEYIDIVDHGAYRSGQHYGLELEFAQSILDSDVTRATYNLFFRRYLPLNTTKKTNLNLQARMGTTSRSLFGDATFQVTGGTAVRGYLRDSIEGNTFYIGNAEYLWQISENENLRGTTFIDIGDASDSLGELSFRDPKVGIGFGLRWKIRSFVRTDIRIDIARGLGADGETKVYAGTNMTF